MVSAVPLQTRAEGVTERVGDILMQCSGSGSVLSGNLSVALPVSITNRVDSNNQTSEVVLSVDYGSGFVPTAFTGQILNQALSFTALNFTIPPSGTIGLRISNIRGAVYQLGASSTKAIQATLTSTSILVNQAQVTVAFAQPGLFATLSSRGSITCVGSPLPSTLSLANLFSAQTAFSSTRITEGVANAFQPRMPGEDNGTRFLVKYTGFPANTHLYLPDLVAGSNAAAATSGGDLGITQQVGQYLPGSHTLLLARVLFSDANGAGGYLATQPTGSSAVALNSVSEVPLSGGDGYAVYEVVDSNPGQQESAQFPTFVGISNVTAPAVAQESITFAPVSNVIAASSTAPIPRFAALPPASDCSVLNDCNASYYPHLSVTANPIQLTAIAGGAMTSQPGYIPIENTGGGLMPWTATVSYAEGTGWLTFDYSSGQNNHSVRTWADAKGLTAGTYHATVTIAAGQAGTATIPVTLTVQAAPVPVTVTPPVTVPAVNVSQVINAATFQATPLVPGSLGTLMGTNLAGANVAVSLDDLPAMLLYSAANQINFQVPAGLGSKTSAQLVVTVDGKKSAPYTVVLASAWPSVFSGGVLNQDNTVNRPDRAARPGTILQIFATGIPGDASVSVSLGDRNDLAPLYAGAAPTLPGIQQINFAIPEDWTAAGGANVLAICTTIGSQRTCSPGYALAIE